MTRWQRWHEPGLEWMKKLERKIGRLDHPEQGGFMSLTNALLYQLEAGADPETVRHLLAALLAFARSAGVSPADLGLIDDPDRLLEKLEPRG